MKRYVICSICLIGLVFIACEAYDKISKDGVIDTHNQSVFQIYSGQYCEMEDENGREFVTNCERLASFVSSDSDSCQNETFSAKQASFPDQKRKIRLCRDLSNPDRKNRESIRMLVFADAGSGQNPGKGYGQAEVAQAMQSVCPSRKLAPDNPNSCDFALVSGDLIYPSGPKDVWDGAFDSKFEDMYKGFGEFDFYVVPGNHDYQGSVLAEIEYSWFSDRWRMLDRHYAIPDLPEWLNIYGLDSNAIIGLERTNASTFDQVAAIKNQICQADGWKILFSHHPSHSNGNHGSDEFMAETLTDIWNECRFDLLISGHDHHQEHVHNNLYDSIIQGAGGAKIKPVSLFPGEEMSGDPTLAKENYIQRYAKSAHGFAVVDVNPTELNMYFFDSDVWEYRDGEFQKPIQFDDYVYHCRWEKGSSEGCVPVSADDDMWLQN